MGNYKEDTSQNFGTVFFIILFLFFALVFSNKSESLSSPTVRYSLQNELAIENVSSHFEGILFFATPILDIQKICVCALHDNFLNFFSLQNKLSDYNRRIAHNFILIQETRFSIESVLLWRFYSHLLLYENDDLPVLS
jgi:hypothetical protein